MNSSLIYNNIHRIKSFCYLIILSAFFVVSCSRKHTPQGDGKKVTITGMASYYADKFIGRPTASGELYDAKKLTAAHKTLPFGTMVLVTNVNNGKSVTVRINDRGPFVAGRIIDLSKSAAQKIDMIGAGVVKVTVIYNR